MQAMDIIMAFYHKYPALLLVMFLLDPLIINSNTLPATIHSQAMSSHVCSMNSITI